MRKPSEHALAFFKGGQMEVVNESETYTYCGDIQSLRIEGQTLLIELLWLAKAEGFPPKEWIADPRTSYSINLELFKVDDNLSTPKFFCLVSNTTGEKVFLHIPGERKVHPTQVKLFRML